MQDDSRDGKQPRDQGGGSSRGAPERDSVRRDPACRDTADSDPASRDSARRDSPSRDSARRDSPSRDSACRDPACRDPACREMVDYLLGELSGQAAEDFEERYLSDQETFEQLQAVEEDLIEEYLRGDLSPAERTLFEQRYMSRPENQDKIAFARTLLDCAYAEESESEAASESLQQPTTSAASPLPGPPPAPARASSSRPLYYAAAAVVIIAIAIAIAIWLGVRVSRLNAELAAASGDLVRLENSQAELRDRLDAEEIDKKALADELQRAMDQIEALQQRGMSATVVSLFLRASATRGGSAPAGQARLSSGVASLELKLDVSRLDSPNYQVTVRQLGGGGVWSGTNLRTQRGASRPVVVAKVPAAGLKAGPYVVTLNGVTATGETRYAGDYSFTVIR